MPSTSQFAPYDTAAQIELPNDLSSLTSIAVSGQNCTIVFVLSTHRSYNASPTNLLLSTPIRGIMNIAVGATLTDATGTAV